jgi:hypothetical protein
MICHDIEPRAGGPAYILPLAWVLGIRKDIWGPWKRLTLPGPLWAPLMAFGRGKASCKTEEAGLDEHAKLHGLTGFDAQNVRILGSIRGGSETEK